MVRLLFVLICGFIIGAVVVEKKHYFSDKVAIPVAFLPDGGQYDGSLLKGELSGLGRIVWPNGDVYHGEFQEGLFDGIGKLKSSEQVYEGEFVAGVASGKGKITFMDGRIYEGDVLNGKAHGYGLLTMSEGEYIGHFSENQFDGDGRMIRANGDIYEGEFKAGLYHGDGLLTVADGKVYQGEFEQGEMSGSGRYRDGDITYSGTFKLGLFDGEGTLTTNDGHYEGEFVAGQFNGQGVYQGDYVINYRGGFSDGLFHGGGVLDLGTERYEGDFEFGLYHGQGLMTYAEPIDGISTVKGEWAFGELVESDQPNVEHNPKIIAEDVLYHQAQRLEQLISAIAPNDPALTEMYFVGIAGDGAQGVFRREVNFIQQQFDEHFATSNKSALLINGNMSYQQWPLATLTSIETLLQGIAKKMDPDNDILYLHLTSHGSQAFDFILSQQGLDLASLDAERLGAIIKALPIRYKVIVISACYSGGFVQPIKDDNTMVIVSAAADKQSFGCSDLAQMTYFGEAFYKDSLLQSKSFAAAFDRSRDIVRGREAKEGYENSGPLIFKPEAIVTQLAKWRKELAEWQRQQDHVLPY